MVKVGEGAGEVFVLAAEGDEFDEVGVWDPVFFGHGEVWWEWDEMVVVLRRKGS